MSGLKEKAKATVTVLIEQGIIREPSAERLGQTTVLADRAVTIIERVLATVAEPANLEVRRLHAAEGMAVSLHVLSGVIGNGAVQRGEMTLEQIQKLVEQATEAYTGGPRARAKPSSDLPPGVLG